MKVVLARRAEKDLREIGSYIAEYDPERVPIAADFPGFGVHRRNHGKYAIFCSVDTDRVTVLRFWQGSRDRLRFRSLAKLAFPAYARYVPARPFPWDAKHVHPFEVTPADEVSSAGAFCVWRERP